MLDRVRNILVLELVQEFHEEEGELQFVSRLIKELFNPRILDADLHEILCSHLRCIIHDSNHIIRYRENIFEVHLRDFKTLLIGDLD